MAETAKARGWLRLAIASAVLAAPLATGQPPAAEASLPNQPDISTREEKATFSARVNLVMVPVVVRDKQGRVVDGLSKDQFRLFDKGKPQVIERFVVERSSGLVSGPAPEDPAPAASEAAPSAERTTPPNAPRRFVGYLFDDVHLEFEDLAQVREAADRHIYADLGPADRAAIFTTSGQGEVDFTDDLGKLRQGLLHLAAHPIARNPVRECPDISFYQADLIVNQEDLMALQAAVADVAACMPAAVGLEQQARVAAQRMLAAGSHETQVSLSVLREVVRRMSAAPGARVVVLVSPGFYTLAEHEQDVDGVIDQALRAKVVINALNGRGLYVPKAGFDASQPSAGTAGFRKSAIERQANMANEATLMGFTAGTGGYYFHNNNDLAAGFRRTAAAPEMHYLLGFQPQNLKLDGSFHGLKVALELKGSFTVEARRGYFAPNRLEDAAATAKREIEDAVYSREEVSDLPVQLRTQFSKGAVNAATVTVLAHVDLAGVKFRKEGDRYLDNITVVAALFDRNGNPVSGWVKHIDLHLLAESLQYRLTHGIPVRMAMQAPPGIYMVRLVVRESEGQLMSAVNGVVNVP